MSKYSEDEFLQLSGIQHFVFCRRQWALIHLEQLWVENYLTQDGRIMHENAHDGLQAERRGDLLISRGLPVRSFQLGLTGICDVVEFKRSNDIKAVPIYGYEGKYLVCPIEYKRGKVKFGLEDEMQLAAQAIALEEMLSADISYGYIFYGKNRRRHKVIIDDNLRQELFKTAAEMHNYVEREYIPKSKYQKKCNACSMKDICQPHLFEHKDVDKYIKDYIYEETP